MNVASPSSNQLPLIFILGEHRSGTSILYNLMVESGCFNPVTVYHILRAADLLENHQSGRTDAAKSEIERDLQALDLKTRVIDNVEVSPDIPEEYCFYLLRACKTLTLSPQSLPTFVKFCSDIMAVSNPDLPLLLKNPWDFPRFRYVHEAFPQAKFIFIHRHPMHSLNSQIRALRTNLFDGNPYNGMLIGEIKGWRSAAKFLLDSAIRFAIRPGSTIGVKHLNSRAEQDRLTFIRHISEVPAECYRSTTYEELCRRPNEVVQELLSFVGAKPENLPDLSERIAPRNVKLLPEIEKCVTQLCRVARESMKYHGFTEEELKSS